MKKLDGFKKEGDFWRRVDRVFDGIGRYLYLKARERVPVFSGDLKGGITYSLNVSANNYELVFSVLSDYAGAVEEGSKPHFTVSPRVAEWAVAHGIPPLLLYRSIAKKGTEPHPFFWPTVEEGMDKLQSGLGLTLTRYIRA
jgi:hypothetical protein